MDVYGKVGAMLLRIRDRCWLKFREIRVIHWNTVSANSVVRFVVGVILMTAGMLKAYERAVGVVAIDGLLSIQWILLFAINLELALGISLVLNLWPGKLRLAAIYCFVIFAVAAFYRYLSGKADCGCFGLFAVDPRITLFVDLTILGVLCYFRPSATESHNSGKLQIRRIVTAVIVIGVANTWLIVTRQDDHPISDGVTIVGNTVMIAPEDWTGKNCPILEYIDIGGQLKSGKWIVVLYSLKCSHCKEVLPKYLEISTMLMAGTGARMALIQIPPVGVAPFDIGTSNSNIVTGQLDSSRRWLMETPVELQLENGTVTFSAAKGEGLIWLTKNIER